MSIYSESNVSKTSSLALKIKRLNSKPGSLPWEEESMTFSRDQGAVLLRLQRENKELRKKLKDFNMNINQIILNFQTTKPLKKTIESKPEDILQSTKKKLEYYEKEYKRLENRIYRLSDPGYEVNLKNSIATSSQKVLELENSIRKYEAGQKLRSKELGGVLETGEKVELYREFFEINKEISIFSQKVEKLEELNNSTMKNMEETTKKIKELEKNVDKDEFYGAEKVNSEESKVKEMMSKAKRGEKMVEGKYKSGIKLLENKIKKLAEDLEKSKAEEEELERKLDRKTQEFKEKQLDLGDLQIKATVALNRKAGMRNQSFSDDYMFLTEKIV